MRKACLQSLLPLIAFAGAQPLHAQAAPPAAPTAAPTPTPAPRIMMLRWFVADGARAELFYQDVLGMKTVQKMGEKVRIMIFPGSSSPGLILIEGPREKKMNGSFIIQVPDLKATLDRAKAMGARLENTDFRQQMGAAQARSSHFFDLDGNEIEVLQINVSPAR
jgi:predicted enzyme related to lactoylglutathione lyase